MAPRSRRLLLQLCAAVAAASCLLAATCPVDAAPPPPPSRDSSVAAGATDIAAAGVSSGTRRLGPAHGLRVLSDIPADGPAAAPDANYDYDIPADAPPTAAGDYDYEYDDTPADDAPAPTAGDGDIIAAGAPAPVVADAATGKSSQPWTAPYVLLFIAVFLGGVLAIHILVIGFIKGAELLADLYAAAKTDHEKVTRVRPVDQDAVEAAGGH